MSKFKIDTVFCGFPGRAESWGLGWGAVYLVRSGSDAVLVDVGGPGVGPYFAAAFKKLGLQFSDITRVFVTHIHWDHVCDYNMGLFPQAEFIYSKADYDYVAARGDAAVYTPALAILDRSGTHVVTKENEEVMPGGRAVFLPGHTPGCIALVLDDDGRTIMFAGDAVKNRLELETCIYNSNPADVVSSRSIRKAKEMADLIYPGHDGPLKMENGKVIALGGNDVKILMPKGLLINGKQELVLSIERES